MEALLSTLTNDDEALVVLSSLGFTSKDREWIKAAGGARACLSSNEVALASRKLSVHANWLLNFMQLRASLDRFYERSGFLLTGERYPSLKLFDLPRGPLVYFGRKLEPAFDQWPGVAIVGSREASRSALVWSKALAKKLATAGFLVVSGGALGVDMAAHAGAVEASLGLTCAVLGSPVDLMGDERPPRLGVLQRGLTTLTPFGLNRAPGRHLFVERNFFVAAMAQALVVVQGSQGSGTLSTVNFARKLGRKVYAIPGCLDDPRSFVPNSLLASGQAQALVDFDAFVKEMVHLSGQKPPNRVLKPPRPPNTSLPEGDLLLQLLKKKQGPLSVDEMICLTGLDLKEIQIKLMKLLLMGAVSKLGSQFVLSDR
jgi:DNA processing protein